MSSDGAPSRPGESLASFARAHLGWTGPVLFVLVVANLLWFISDAQRFGGGALGGYLRSGHYYLANHGAFTEVDRATWEWMRLRELSVLVSIPAAALGALLLSMLGRGRWLVGSMMSDAADRRRAILRSGREIYRAAPGLRIGAVELLPGSTLLIVHPAGIIVRQGSDGFAIARTDVTTLNHEMVCGIEELQIQHLAPNLGSPFVVVVGPDERLVPAIDRAFGPVGGQC